MHKVLIWRLNAEVLGQLRDGIQLCGWAVDACDGMLEMLRRLEEEQYDVVVLSAGRVNVELSTALGAMRMLERKPRILVNIPETEDALPAALVSLGCSIIRGRLTAGNVLEFAQATQ
ncbi:MAG: hypothetical protein C4532_11235 [Candidatus Abyssobacteria bacterium SURF_17]|uniref:Response regulatory domain-containing protein n=1 Tax=Candidatus Abyssobacteria bacterium SURF_17 TaxID=2093361 RepID=A0A419EWW3_9BACT|nr:MAG: hypothetical protein C4532_11235 [Candidatus Abyssubacteria bacterium SURF_17]